MLKTVSAKERLDRYAKSNPREMKPFTREEAKKEADSQVRMK